MKVHDWLKSATDRLDEVGVSTARLDALVMLEDIVKSDRAWLLAHPELELKSAQLTRLTNLLSQRSRHIPLAYIRGKTEFYGREFVVNHFVLEPRPESEAMIELLKDLVMGTARIPGPSLKGLTSARIADVGTGCGALGITAKLELPDCLVDLIDIDDKALKVAKTNVDLFTLSINLIESNLLKKTSENYDLLLCNLPYVPDKFNINLSAAHEPTLAIFGGPDGLDIYRQLFSQISKLPKKPLYILSEAMPPQHNTLEKIANKGGYQLTSSRDFIQVFATSQL